MPQIYRGKCKHYESARCCMKFIVIHRFFFLQTFRVLWYYIKIDIKLIFSRIVREIEQDLAVHLKRLLKCNLIYLMDYRYIYFTNFSEKETCHILFKAEKLQRY